jgi:hypothetical protein
MFPAIRLPVSTRSLFHLIRSILSTILDFQAALLLPWGQIDARNLEICRDPLFSTECLIEGWPVN